MLSVIRLDSCLISSPWDSDVNELTDRESSIVAVTATLVFHRSAEGSLSISTASNSARHASDAVKRRWNDKSR